MGPFGTRLSVGQVVRAEREAQAAARGPVPYAEAGGSPDWVTEMRALEASHPTLTWLPRVGDGPHRAVWMEDDGPHREAQEDLRDLVLYLRAHFRRPS